MTYRLTISTRTSGSFNYDATLFAPDGRKVSSTWTDTVWGAKWWARRQARKDQRTTASYEFEVRP